MTTFTEGEMIIDSSISAYGKGQSTIYALQAIWDDIIKAMRRGEVTMMILADLCIAFETNFDILLRK